MDKLFNTFKNHRWQNIPKTTIIKNDIELVNWLKETFPDPYSNIIETDKYLIA